MPAPYPRFPTYLQDECAHYAATSAVRNATVRDRGQLISDLSPTSLWKAVPHTHTYTGYIINTLSSFIFLIKNKTSLLVFEKNCFKFLLMSLFLINNIITKIKLRGRRRANSLVWPQWSLATNMKTLRHPIFKTLFMSVIRRSPKKKSLKCSWKSWKLWILSWENLQLYTFWDGTTKLPELVVNIIT